MAGGRGARRQNVHYPIKKNKKKTAKRNAFVTRRPRRVEIFDYEAGRARGGQAGVVAVVVVARTHTQLERAPRCYYYYCRPRDREYTATRHGRRRRRRRRRVARRARTLRAAGWKGIGFRGGRGPTGIERLEWGNRARADWGRWPPLRSLRSRRRTVGVRIRRPRGGAAGGSAAQTRPAAASSPKRSVFPLPPRLAVTRFHYYYPFRTAPTSVRFPHRPRLRSMRKFFSTSCLGEKVLVPYTFLEEKKKRSTFIKRTLHTTRYHDFSKFSYFFEPFP